MPRCCFWWCRCGWTNWWVKNRWKTRGWEEKHCSSLLRSRKLQNTNTILDGGFPILERTRESSTFWWKRKISWLWNPIRKSVFAAKRGCCLLVCVRFPLTLFKVKTGHAWPSDLCIYVSTGPNQGWMVARACECEREAGVSWLLRWLRLNGMLFSFVLSPTFHLAAAYLIFCTEIYISAGQMWPVSLCGNPQFWQTSDWLIILNTRLCAPAHPLHACTLYDWEAEVYLPEK